MNNDDTLAALDAQLGAMQIDSKPTCDLPRQLPPYYYDGKNYYYADANHIIHTMNERSLRARLQTDGYVVLGANDKPTVEPYIRAIQDRQAVRFAGPFAGYKTGLQLLSDGRRVLVTEPATLLEAKPGTWETLRSLLINLLGEEQAQILLRLAPGVRALV
ncbi:MAG: hypothetical protein QM796_10870 [Chthoniobacteraceae bacterium]